MASVRTLMSVAFVVGSIAGLTIPNSVSDSVTVNTGGRFLLRDPPYANPWHQMGNAVNVSLFHPGTLSFTWETTPPLFSGWGTLIVLCLSNETVVYSSETPGSDVLHVNGDSAYRFTLTNTSDGFFAVIWNETYELPSPAVPALSL